MISAQKRKHLDVTTMFTCSYIIYMQTLLLANQNVRTVLVFYKNKSTHSNYKVRAIDLKQTRQMGKTSMGLVRDIRTPSDGFSLIVP